jgi:hypothetical protein
MWHVALKPDGTLQDIVAAYIPFGEVDVLKMLLQTNRPGGKSIDFDEHTGYLFAYDNNLTRPYPSVMIFRYNRSAESNTIVDIQKEDFRAVAYACENLLK